MDSPEKELEKKPAQEDNTDESSQPSQDDKTDDNNNLSQDDQTGVDSPS